MKILFLPNWKVEYCDSRPKGKQPPDYYVMNEKYWFFRYFDSEPEVDVLDIRSNKVLENFEKEKIRFYIWQALRAIPRLNEYDLIISHGMQSGVVISLWRRLFKTRAKHLVFDIGAFNSAAESGFALKTMQFSSKSIDSIIYHTSSQKDYYKRFFPWIVNKSYFMRFGTDSELFCDDSTIKHPECIEDYCICVGYSKRDWDTAIKAFVKASIPELKLKLIGHVSKEYENIPGVEQIGMIPINELKREIARSAFGILPLKSFNYSYGQMTLMQQMAMGKCVIASKVPSLIDYATDKENAIFYEPENSDDLCEKIRQVWYDHALRHRIEINAYSYIMNNCNEKIMAKEIEKVIGSTCQDLMR